MYDRKSGRLPWKFQEEILRPGFNSQYPDKSERVKVREVEERVLGAPKENRLGS